MLKNSCDSIGFPGKPYGITCVFLNLTNGIIAVFEHLERQMLKNTCDSIGLPVKVNGITTVF